MKVISKLIWDHPRSFSVHAPTIHTPARTCTPTHTHTPCSPALLETKHLWMGRHPRSPQAGFALDQTPPVELHRSPLCGLVGFPQIAACQSSHTTRQSTTAFPASLPGGSPHCVPLETPLRSSPEGLMLDETDHILVPGAEVIFHSAVIPN